MNAQYKIEEGGLGWTVQKGLVEVDGEGRHYFSWEVVADFDNIADAISEIEMRDQLVDRVKEIRNMVDEGALILTKENLQDVFVALKQVELESV